MRYFTDSPYERMMMQPPREQREDERSDPPKENPCYGCDHKRKTCCSRICYRDLIITPKEKRLEKSDR